MCVAPSEALEEVGEVVEALQLHLQHRVLPCVDQEEEEEEDGLR